MDKSDHPDKWKLPLKVGLAILGAATLIVLAFLILPKLSFEKGEAAISIKKDRLVISAVQKGPFKEIMTVAGNIFPVNIVYLSAAEGGSVEQIFLEPGSMVKEGDQILRLANTNLLLDIMWREAELFQQSNNLRNTRLAIEQYKLQLNQQFADIENKLQQQRRVYERYQELEKDKLISRHEYELAKDQYEFLLKQKELTVESQKSEIKFRQAQIEALEESLLRMQANLDVVKQKQENLTIVAPVSGQLTSLNAEIGQSKAPGERIGQIDRTDGFKIRAGIDERFISLISTEKSGEFDFAGQTYQVDVRKVYPEVKDGKFEVDFEFLGKEPPGIKRGQSLRIRLELEDAAEVLLLPQGDFIQDNAGKWVYVLEESGKAAVRRRVRLGRQNQKFIEVLEGLGAGEFVITSSYEDFRGTEKLILK